MNKIYTGVGSRSTPLSILSLIADLADELARAGWVLRSGGARGADAAFEAGHRRVTSERLEIYLPWPNFNKNPSTLHGASVEALQLAAKHHPSWGSCDEMARTLHGRNTYQVLGRGLDAPSDVLICWTEDGCTGRQTRTRDTGGTGTAIVLAEAYKVPVFNLANRGAADQLREWLARPVPVETQGALF